MDADCPHHNRDLVLQKYILLHEQHESLRQHLDTLRPLQTSLGLGPAITTTPSPAGSPTQGSGFSSNQTSPFHSRHNSFSRGSSTTAPMRRSSAPSARATGFPGGCAVLETVLDEATLSELAAEERKLFDVNEGIKRALTELLNCETTRSDHAFRTWVQCRLMDTEKELRSGRRRRSAPEA